MLHVFTRSTINNVTVPQPDVWPRQAPASVVSSLPTPDKRHLASHNGHELHVRIEWQIGHIKDRTGHVLDIHQRFDGN
ncbi:MAG: hypothetical protein QOJ41_2716, partial [Acidobacteriaceae bacterium]|nr:hypothetical protein [Acidobacteriaceae bacterium]